MRAFLSKNTKSSCQLSALTQSLTVLSNFGSYNLSELSTKETHMFLEEEESVRQFNKVLKFDGERYEVPLLWKGAAPPLRSNYFQAVNRLESVERQLKENPEKANAYTRMPATNMLKRGML